MIIGFCFEKNGFRVAWLDGTRAAPNLIDREKCTNPAVNSITNSASWYDGRFEQVLKKRAIDAAAFKIHFDIKNQEQLLNHGAPIGILALRAHSMGIDLHAITKMKIKSALTFGLPKKSDTSAWIDNFKDAKPYWDSAMRDAVLVSTARLP